MSSFGNKLSTGKTIIYQVRSKLSVFLNKSLIKYLETIFGTFWYLVTWYEYSSFFRKIGYNVDIGTPIRWRHLIFCLKIFTTSFLSLLSIEKACMICSRWRSYLWVNLVRAESVYRFLLFFTLLSVDCLTPRRGTGP